MRSTKALIALLPLLLCVTTASGCAGQERTHLASPPAADIKALVAPKPEITEDVLTSDQAHEDYGAAVEGWGDGLSAAGGRLCRWFDRAGVKLGFKCPPPVAGDPDR